MQADRGILETNGASWDAIADDWLGSTALPIYGPTLPTEDSLGLLGDLSGKCVLDIGCGSGHSLLYCANRGAAELWGLDLSRRQIQNADALLRQNGMSARLFASPMERNPGIPQGRFDVVYSIYALGWTTDLRGTVRLAYEYLRPSGSFIFSWDNPLMQCIQAEDGRYSLCRSYLDEGVIHFEKGGQPMALRNWKLSSYIDALADAGFVIERLVEETEQSILETEQPFTPKYYSRHKARLINTSFVLKATKRQCQSAMSGGCYQ